MKFSAICLSILATVASAATITPRQVDNYNYVLSEAERLACQPISLRYVCGYARTFYKTATLEAIARYGVAGLTNGKTDAFRICYWNAMMQNDVRFKNNAAATIATNHINLSNDRTAAEKNMDLYNAETGRSWGNSILPGVKDLQKHLQQGCVYALTHPLHPLKTLNNL